MTTPKHERRAAPRAHADLPLQLAPASGAQPATLKDISTSGLCCRFAEPVTEMTQVQLQLQLPGTDSLTALTGVVVRCDKCRGVAPPTYEVAIYFVDMQPQTRLAITAYVEKQLQAAR